MRQLYFIEPGKFEWRDVPLPRVERPRQAVVQPLAVARCDLDFYIATGTAPFRGPFAFGHEMVGTVIDAGDRAGVQPGDRVVVPFQINCGECGRCRAGLTGSCEAVPPYAAFGLAGGRQDFGGALSDAVLVPFADAMLVKLPDGMDPVAVAAAADNLPDGWRAVAPALAAKPGATVLVIGGKAQSVGLFAAASAQALGAGRVLYLDDDPVRRATAATLGVEAEVLRLEAGREPSEQFDVVVEAAGDAAALGFAIRSTTIDGELTSVAMYFEPLTAVPLTQAYYKGLTIRTSRVSARRWLPDVLSCMACGKLHARDVVHRVASFGEAGDAMIDPGPKLVFVPEA